VAHQIGDAACRLDRTGQEMSGIAVSRKLPQDQQDRNERNGPKPYQQWI
jgi:hypothetical protein